MILPLPNPSWRPRVESGVGLTGADRLELSRALVGIGKRFRGLEISKLAPLAENDVEQAAIAVLSRIAPKILHRCGDPLRGLFYFKCVLVPHFCGILIKRFKSDVDGLCLWLSETATNFAAFERTALERLYRGWIQSAPGGPNRGRRWLAPASSSERWNKPILKWFDEAPEGYLFWIERFRMWRDYAQASSRFFLETQSRDIKYLKGNEQEAARLAIMQKSGSLPPELFGGALQQILSDHVLRKIFRKNRKKRVNRPRNLHFKTWLIEIWPLVVEYDWNYVDVQRAANEHFDELPETGEKASRVEECCKSIGLKLGIRGRSKVGQPKAPSNPSGLPMMGELAVWIRSMGEDPSGFVLSSNSLPLL